MQDTIAVSLTIARPVAGQIIKSKFRKVMTIVTEFGSTPEIEDEVRDRVYTDWSHVPAESISAISWNYA